MKRRRKESAEVEKIPAVEINLSSDIIELSKCGDDPERSEAESKYQEVCDVITFYREMSSRNKLFLQSSLAYMIHRFSKVSLANIFRQTSRDERCVLYDSDAIGLFLGQGYHCPFCINLDCGNIKSLSFHLYHCHDRFQFEVHEDEYSNQQHRVFFALNSDTKKLTVNTLTRKKNCLQRMPHAKALRTNLMVTNSKRNRYRFLGQESTDFVTFNKLRTYYHSRTGQVIRSGEFDNNSEDEEYEEWQKEKSFLFIDEYDDVNPGEKKIMKLWNTYFMQRSTKFFAEKYYHHAMIRFIRENFQKIVTEKLRKNFILKLISLFKLGHIDMKSTFDLIDLLNRNGASNGQSDDFSSAQELDEEQHHQDLIGVSDEEDEDEDDDEDDEENPLNEDDDLPDSGHIIFN